MARTKVGLKRRRRFNIAGGKHSRKYQTKQKHAYKWQSQHDGGTKLTISRTLGSEFSASIGKGLTVTITTSKADTHQGEIQHDSSYRLIDLNLLEKNLKLITIHVANCKSAISMGEKGFPPFSYLKESKSYGLASHLNSACNGCGKVFSFDTSKKVFVNDSRHFDVNVRGVWGSMACGNGGSNLQELMATLNAPSLCSETFSKVEDAIGQSWSNLLNEDMLEAGREEKRLATERGDFHDGVPAITVICDGGWSKRTHKHSYNALGGVGVIIGAATKQVLHVGVRNKYCSVCARAENASVSPKPHTCFKNWNDSSQAMESDIIVDGFNQAEVRHGVRYMRMIADGDSSVYANIQDKVPVWGRHVSKMECANHTCKCLRTNLEKLVAEKPHYKGTGKLTEQTRLRIVNAVRCSIRMRSLCADKAEGVRLLRHDITNCVYHVFGMHEKCSNFCKVKFPDGPDLPTDDPAAGNITNLKCNGNGDTIGNVFDQNVLFWYNCSTTKDEALARGSVATSSTSSISENTSLIKDVALLLLRVSQKADRLLGNFTTNLAESWMAIRAKFDGGKQVNRCLSGSWHTRCFGAGLRRNVGIQWSPKMWKMVTGTEPGCVFSTVYRQRDIKASRDIMKKSKPEYKLTRFTRKQSLKRHTSSLKARQSYGEHSLTVETEITTSELESLKASFLQREIYVSKERMLEIQNSTACQSSCPMWFDERKKRITASNFKSVVVRRPKLPVSPLVRRLLYSNFSGTSATRFGLQEEASARLEYLLEMEKQGHSLTITPVGLSIDTKYPFLAASPDGLVVENGETIGLIEIKHVLHNKPITLNEAAKTMRSSFCLALVDNVMHLKQTHAYYMQCQGLLNILQLPWIDFVVRSLHPYQFFVQRIYKDEDLWHKTMLPKLQAFYHKALLPELAAPRHNKYPGIREPGVWFNVASFGKPSESSRTTSPPTQQCQPLRSHRARKIKFLGRRIRHQWITEGNQTEWYEGSVTAVISGVDGDPDAIYEVDYDEEDDLLEVDKLQTDLEEGSLYFIDI